MGGVKHARQRGQREQRPGGRKGAGHHQKAKREPEALNHGEWLMGEPQPLNLLNGLMVQATSCKAEGLGETCM